MKQLEFSHPFSEAKIEDRLLKEYVEHDGRLVIGVDFDNTIFDTHAIGGDFSCVIEVVRECILRGMVVCLYTSSEEPKDIDRKVSIFTEMFGVKPDYVNYSPLSPKASKPFFNILLDDRAGLEESWRVLYHILEKTS